MNPNWTVKVDGEVKSKEETIKPPVVPATYTVFDNDEFIGTFSLQQLPGCCGVCVSFWARTADGQKRKGYGTALNEYRKELAKSMGYTVLMCTDVAHNVPQRKILEKNGWKTLQSFTNKRTGNTVNISTVVL
jgi:hypothetical protein